MSTLSNGRGGQWSSALAASAIATMAGGATDAWVYFAHGPFAEPRKRRDVRRRLSREPSRAPGGRRADRSCHRCQSSGTGPDS